MTCDRCGKPTFAGCGAHVEQVLRDVAPKDRCRCREASATPPEVAEAVKPFWKWF